MKKQFVRKTPRHHIYYVPADANSLQYAIACSMRRNMKRANLLCLKADNFITKYMEQVILDNTHNEQASQGAVEKIRKMMGGDRCFICHGYCYPAKMCSTVNRLPQIYEKIGRRNIANAFKKEFQMVYAALTNKTSFQLHEQYLAIDHLKAITLKELLSKQVLKKKKQENKSDNIIRQQGKDLEID